MTTPDPEQNAREVLAPVELLERARDFVNRASSFDWNEDRCVMTAVHLAADLSAALTTPTPRQEEAVAVPAGMVPWHGGDRAPDDWDGGPVAWSDGGTGTPTFLAWRHDEENWPYVIAYTPRATPDTAPLSGEDAPASVIAPGEELKDRHAYDSGFYVEIDDEDYTLCWPDGNWLWANAAGKIIVGKCSSETKLAPQETTISTLLAQPRQTDETVERLESQLRALLHGKFSSLMIGFNDEHAPNYQTAAEWDNEEGDPDDWVSHDERQKARKDNSVWSIQWYPETPVGFHQLKASSLSALFDVLATPADDGEQRG